MPSEVEISDETTGWESKSWVATCHDRRFVCSQVTTGTTYGGDAKSPVIGSNSQINCTPEGGPESTSSASIALSNETQASDSVAKSAHSDPPTGAAGFVFDKPMSDAQAACENKRLQWVTGEKLSTCSGPVAELGFAAKVNLRACDDMLCRIDLLVTPESEQEWLEVFGTVKQQLTAKYGNPTQSDRQLPSDCEKEFVSCVENGTAHFDYQWRWPNGQLLRLQVARARRGNAVMQLTYLGARSHGGATAPAL